MREIECFHAQEARRERQRPSAPGGPRESESLAERPGEQHRGRREQARQQHRKTEPHAGHEQRWMSRQHDAEDAPRDDLRLDRGEELRQRAHVASEFALREQTRLEGVGELVVRERMAREEEARDQLGHECCDEHRCDDRGAGPFRAPCRRLAHCGPRKTAPDREHERAQTERAHEVADVDVAIRGERLARGDEERDRRIESDRPGERTEQDRERARFAAEAPREDTRRPRAEQRRDEQRECQQPGQRRARVFGELGHHEWRGQPRLRAEPAPLHAHEPVSAGHGAQIEREQREAQRGECDSGGSAHRCPRLARRTLHCRA